MTILRYTINPFQVAAIGLSLLLLMIVLQGYFFYQQKSQAEEARKWVSHTYEVLGAIRTPFAKIKDAQIAQRGFLLTGNESFLEPYYAAIGDKRGEAARSRMGYLDVHDFDDNLLALRALIKDNPDQMRPLEKLEVMIKDEMSFINNSIETYRRNPGEAISLIKNGRGKILMDEVRALITQMMEREQQLLEKRLAKDAQIDNTFTWSIIVAALITYCGLLLAIVFITRNFAKMRRGEQKLKEKEADFRAAAEGGMDPFFLFRSERDDKNEIRSLNLQYMNPIAERMMGMSARLLIGKPIEEILNYHSVSSGDVAHNYAEVMKAGKACETEYSIISGPKAGRFYQEQVVPLTDGLVVSCRDITERKEMDRMKNEFVSTVSHELRTPLTSIRGSLGLVLGEHEKDMPGDSKELLTIAYNNCERLVRLINDILDIEKIESGKMVFDCKPTKLIPLVKQVIDANLSFASKYGAQIVLEHDTNADALTVIADSDRFVQVLTNLLSNAIKFSPQGGAVRVSCRDAGNKIHIAVKDQGSGIPLEFRDRIFQKFAQADSSDTRQKGGTGLGLSIVRTIVEQMKGEIGFESELGKGTSFYFTLPGTKGYIPEQNDTSFVTAPRLVVCEDEEDIANLLRLILERAGFHVDNAFNAASAYALLEKNKYMALILDLMLPDKNGVTMIREMRADPRYNDLPIIVVSAKAEEGRKTLNGDAIQVVDWMHKPIDVQKLVQTVKNLRAKNTPRILHVEDDDDISNILRLSLNKIADVLCVPTLQKAREYLNTQIFDLVVLDIGLPDGKGTELLPLLGSEGKHPTPVILFTAAEISQDVSNRVAASLTKSLVSEDKLVDTIRQLLHTNEQEPQKMGKRI